MVFNLWATEVFCSGPKTILAWKSRICTMSCLLIGFESLQKVAVDGELTVFFLFFFWRSPAFWRKNRLNLGEDHFFLEINWFWQKNRLNLIQDWWKFGSSSFTDVSSSKKAHPTLRNPGYATAHDIGKLQLSNTFESRAMENFQNENGPRLEKDWEPLIYTN